MLQDDFLPTYDFSERHHILINQVPDRIYTLVYDFDFSGSWIIRTLFKLRGMGTDRTMKSGLLQGNFIELAHRPNEEMVLGLVGQFWRANGNLQKLEPAEFLTFCEPGFLKATWNFQLVPRNEQVTVLHTETRVLCMDQEARRKFSPYWFIIRPFSGIIRKEILRGIKKKAESLCP